MINEKPFQDDYPTAVSAAALRRRIVVTALAGQTVITYELPGHGQVSIGRGRESMLRIDEPSISRLHATLYIGSELSIEDVGSTNGTRVAGRVLGAGERTRVELGQPLELGQVTVALFPASVLPRSAAAASRTDDSNDERRARAGTTPPAIVVLDPRMQQLHAMARRVATSDISVLLLGETGCGKEVLAELIHHQSARATGPFLRLNCAELAESLLESEMFGHEKGAFSGAVRAKAGLLESADGGTVFLDELGEMPVGLQAKLLRVIEDRTVRRIGSLRPQPIDVRFIAATNRDLREEARRGRFRADLFYRLNGVDLTIPPLRERRSEIEAFVQLFVQRFAREIGRARPPRVSAAALELLGKHSWPGNIRELRNVIQRSVLMSSDADEIGPEHTLLDGSNAPVEDTLEGPFGLAPSDADTLRQALPPAPGADERQRIVEALSRCAGNQTQAAKLLGMGRTRLVERLAEYELPRPRKRAPG